MIEVIHVVSPYNTRRYSRPWIARITAWPIGEKPRIAFGTTSRDGVTMTLAANPGDAVYWGPRDNHGNNSEWNYALVDANGVLQKCSEAEARAAARVYAPN